MIIIAALFTASAVISLVMFKKVSAAAGLGTGHSSWGGVPSGLLLPDQWDPGPFLEFCMFALQGL